MSSSKFKSYTTLTSIGLHFGVSAQQVGKVLNEQGYREAKTLHPTPKALEKHLAVRSQISTGQHFWMWKSKDLLRIMQDAGWVKQPAEDIRAAATTTEVVKLLKHASHLHAWNGEKAWKLVAEFVPDANSNHVQMLLEAIKKSNASLFPVFQKQYETVLTEKRLHEALAADFAQRCESAPSKI